MGEIMKEKLSALQREFFELRKQREDGKRSEEDFRSQVQAIAVEDEAAAGRWWNINPENGRWIYFDGKKWVERAPEGFAAEAGVEPAGPANLAPATVLRPAKSSRKALWVAVIALAVVVIIAGSVGAWFLFFQQPSYSGGSGGGGGERTDPERELLYDFYRVYAQGDYDELNKFLEIKRPVPTGMSEVDQARQLTARANIEQLGEYVGQYIMDFRFVGAPKAGNIEDLLDVFAETEIHTGGSLNKDGWGNPYIYEADTAIGSQEYTIMSCGSDGMEGPVPQETGVVRRPEEDLIWANGTWVQKPEWSETGEDRAEESTWLDVAIPSLPKGFNYRIGEVKTEEKKTDAKMILTIDGRQYEQKVSMLNDFGAGRRIVSVDDITLLPEQESLSGAAFPGASEASASVAIPKGGEAEVLETVEKFIEAFKDYNISGFRDLSTGKLRTYVEHSLRTENENEEQYSRVRSLLKDFRFEIDDISVLENGLEAKAVFIVSGPYGQPTKQYLKLRLESGAWKIYSISNTEEEPKEEREEDVAEEPEQ
jgi:hypothetical protein